MSANTLDVVDFARFELKVKLYPAQIFVLKMIYGLPLDSIKFITWRNPVTQAKHRMTERQYLKFLYDEGRCSTNQEGQDRYTDVVLACGRRSGKQTLSSICALYEVYRLLSLDNPHKRYGLPEERKIHVSLIGIDKDQTQELFSDCCNYIGKNETLKKYVTSNTLGDIKFRAPACTEVEHNIRLSIKPSYSKGLRGTLSSMVILDEAAFFDDKDNPEVTQEVYNALGPATGYFTKKDQDGLPCGKPESKILVLTSPNGKQGFVYRQFSRAMEGLNVLALQIPTWEMNPTLPDSYYAHQIERDFRDFTANYGGEFV